jgi:hypothetical protein
LTAVILGYIKLMLAKCILTVSTLTVAEAY